MSNQRFILAGVMGWPVAHSRSPVIHNHWIAKHVLKGAYVQLSVQPEQLGDAIRGLKALGFAGCNVTVPHKVRAMQWMDELHPVAPVSYTPLTLSTNLRGARSGVALICSPHTTVHSRDTSIRRISCR